MCAGREHSETEKVSHVKLANDARTYRDRDGR